MGWHTIGCGNEKGAGMGMGERGARGAGRGARDAKRGWGAGSGKGYAAWEAIAARWAVWEPGKREASETRTAVSGSRCERIEASELGLGKLNT